MTAQQNATPSAPLGPAAHSYADRFAPQVIAMTKTRRTKEQIDADNKHWDDYYDREGWL